jgi:hypothetical protein
MAFVVWRQSGSNVLIYAISQLGRGLIQSRAISRKVRVTADDFLITPMRAAAPRNTVS